MRILIAEDHEVVRRGVRALVMGLVGAEVCGEAVDGQDAIEKAHQLRPDIILMDLSMPRLNGIEATRRICYDLPDTKIIILSQHDLPHFIRACSDAGASAFVSKAAIWTKLAPAIQQFQPRDVPPPEQPRVFSVGEVMTPRHEQTLVGMAHLNADGRWVRANDRFCQMLGYTRPELEKLRFQDVAFDTDLQTLFLLNAPATVGALDRPEPAVCFVAKNGKIVPVHLTIGALRDHEGTLEYSVVITEEQSPAKKLIAELQKSAEQLDMVAGAMDLAVTRCTRDLHYAWVNEKYARWLGKTPDRIAGKKIVDVIGKAALDCLLPRFENVLRGAPIRYEADVPYEGIGVRRVLAHYRPTKDPHGEVDGWAALVQDFTAQDSPSS